MKGVAMPKSATENLILGGRIKEAAQAAGLSLRELARRAGMSLGQVQNYINGRDPQVLVAIKIADALGLSPASLLLGENTSMPVRGLARIPVMDIKVHAGRGGENFSEAELHKIDLPIEEMRLAVTSAKNLAGCYITGTSMEPTLGDGDLVIVDRGRRDARQEPGIFLMRFDGSLSIKRVTQLSRHSFQVVSDNPNKAMFPDQVLDVSGQIDFDVVGRAVWVGQRL
jgi:transcriptional regulator with XRE-family HTH domain